MEQTTRRNLLAKRPNQLVLAGVLSFLLTLVATAASDDNDPVPSRPNWIRAGTSSSDNWSREALLSQILGSSKVETREQVSALLGPPDYTSRNIMPDTASQIGSTPIACRQGTTGRTT
jgi:hypothetical protein